MRPSSSPTLMGTTTAPSSQAAKYCITVSAWLALTVARRSPVPIPWSRNQVAVARTARSNSV